MLIRLFKIYEFWGFLLFYFFCPNQQVLRVKSQKQKWFYLYALINRFDCNIYYFISDCLFDIRIALSALYILPIFYHIIRIYFVNRKIRLLVSCKGNHIIFFSLQTEGFRKRIIFFIKAKYDKTAEFSIYKHLIQI